VLFPIVFYMVKDEEKRRKNVEKKGGGGRLGSRLVSLVALSVRRGKGKSLRKEERRKGVPEGRDGRVSFLC